jgi:hypothetical protein
MKRDPETFKSLYQPHPTHALTLPRYSVTKPTQSAGIARKASASVSATTPSSSSSPVQRKYNLPPTLSRPHIPRLQVLPPLRRRLPPTAKVPCPKVTPQPPRRDTRRPPLRLVEYILQKTSTPSTLRWQPHQGRQRIKVSRHTTVYT